MNFRNVNIRLMITIKKIECSIRWMYRKRRIGWIGASICSSRKRISIFIVLIYDFMYGYLGYC